MRYAFGFAIATAALAAATGCGAAHRTFAVSGPWPIRISPPSPTALRFSTASNRRFAHEDVRKLIRILVLPHGARVVAKVPETAPSGFRSVTGFRLPGIAMTLRIWVVHEPFGRVVRFVQTHAHPRPRPEVRFRGKDNGLRLGTVGWYEFAPVPGRSWQRWLNVDMAPLRGGGTAVIAQAGDAWVQGSRGVLLPAAVKRIDILSRIGSRHPNVLVHVRRPYDVGSIVSFVNGLGLANSSRVACLAVLVGGPTVTLRFRTAEGRLLARATVQDTPGPAAPDHAAPCS